MLTSCHVKKTSNYVYYNKYVSHDTLIMTSQFTDVPQANPQSRISISVTDIHCKKIFLKYQFFPPYFQMTVLLSI